MSDKILKVIAIVALIAVLLSAFNSYLILNNTTNIQEQLDMQKESITDLNNNQSQQISDLKIALDEKKTSLSALESRLETVESLQATLDIQEDMLNVLQSRLETVELLQTALDAQEESLNILQFELDNLESQNTNQQEQIAELQLALNQTQLALEENSLSLLTILNQVSALEEIFDQLTDQTPANVYASTYKSVVLISTPIGQGSGFLFENKNTIITNYHVVESATDIDIQYFDGSRTYANIIGSDPYSDLAVLQVSMAPDESEPLFLSNKSVVIGQQVVAIGNPFGSTDSLTAGYISQLNRLIDLYPLIIPVYQLDLTITFGNSGGPLLDLSGNVIGITNAGTYFGLNYAIPLEIINRVVPSLINEGEYQHPFVGVSLIGLTPDLITYFNISNLNRNQNGLLVADVFSGYPAEEAGLNPVIFEEYGIIAVDIILAVDGVPLFTIEDWVAYVETQISADETITLTLWRSGEIISIEVTTTQRPPP